MEASLADAEHVEYVGHIGGESRAVSLQGYFAYIGEGYSLTILNISIPSAPTVVGKTDFFSELVYDVHVSGDMAYVANYSAGLRVVDVSNPAHPVEVGYYDAFGHAYGVYAQAGIAYVAESGGGLRVIDVSDPSHPVEVGFYNTPGLVYDVYVSGSIAYLADNDSLRMIDVSDPTNPTEVGIYDSEEWGWGAYKVCVIGSIAYLTTGNSGFAIVDVSDPTNPTEMGFWDSHYAVLDLYASEGIVYAVNELNGGLRAVDVSNPALPVEVGFYDGFEGAYDVYVSNDLAYVVDADGGLRIVDVSDPALPVESGFYNAPGLARDVYVQDDVAYVTDLDGGLRLVDVSDPSAPVGEGFYDAPSWSKGVHLNEGIAYLTSKDLFVLNVSDPMHPTEIGYLDTPGSAQDVYVQNDVAYVADHDDGLRVVDVSDPANPVELGFYDTPAYAYGVHVSGSIAYVADDFTLRLIDVSDPTHPTEISHCSSSARNVHVIGHIAYVAADDGGLRIVDVSDPVNPIEIGSYTTDSARDVYVSSTTAYVADWYGGLKVVDVSDPANPTLLGFYDTPGRATSVYAEGNTAYVADYEGGLFILRYTGDTAITGQVTDGNGAPITNAVVHAKKSGELHTTSTDATGAYSFSGLEPGAYTVIPFVEGYTFDPAFKGVSVPPRATVDFVGTSLASSAIWGRILDEHNNPVSGVSVILKRSPGGQRYSSFTDNDGYYVSEELPPGNYTVFPIRQGHTFSPSFDWVTVPPDAIGRDFTAQTTQEIDIIAAHFPNGNQAAHHTDKWPDYVFRRAQWLAVHLDLNGIYDPSTDHFIWSVRGPNQSGFTRVPEWSPALSDSSWAVRQGAMIGQTHTNIVFIPVDASVGRYTLQVAAYRNVGGRSVLQDVATTSDFYVIFNPWNTDQDPRYDADVYNPRFLNTELHWYAESGIGRNYYPNGANTVQWILDPFIEEVFFPVMADVAGESSAFVAMQTLVDKTRRDDGTPTDNEILRGRWGSGSRADWRSVPAIMSAWSSGSDPTGQCMDFGGLTSAFARAVGIPVRMLTCVDCYDPHKGTIWNFHVWNEVWVNEVSSVTWSPADGTYGIAPTSRQHYFIQQEVSTSSGVYAYDARTASQVNLLGDYRNSTAATVAQAENMTQPVSVTVSTDRPAYDFGEAVSFTVTVTNHSTSDFSGVLQTSVASVDYTGASEFLSYPTSTLTIPVGDTVLETYTLPQSEYGWNGNFLATATVGDVTAHREFEVDGGLDVRFDAPEEVLAGGAFSATLLLTNTLDTPIADTQVEAYLPASASGVAHPISFTLPSLAAGEVYTDGWTLRLDSSEAQLLAAYAFSPDAGREQAHHLVDVLGYAHLDLLMSLPLSVIPGLPFTTTASVRNAGDLNSGSLEVALSPSEQLTFTSSLTASLSDLAPGGVQTVTWKTVALTTGLHSLHMMAGAEMADNMQTASQLVVAVQESRAVTLSIDQDLVTADYPVTLTLTLQNLTSGPDDIILNVGSDNPHIGFALYDGDTPLEGAVTLPALGEHYITLVVGPAANQEGTITVSAVSQLDPNAVASLDVVVRSELRPLTDVLISGPTIGYTDTQYTFTATTVPMTTTQPLTLTWMPTPLSGQGTLTTTYQWSTPDTYTLTLRAENYGEAVTATRQITILDQALPPVASFTASPLIGQSPLTVVFTDTTSGIVDAWAWHFGDGMTSTLEGPTHTYVSASTYTVTLTVDGPSGSDTAVKPAYITVEQRHIYLPLVLRNR
jgi:hypothetical protein